MSIRQYNTTVGTAATLICTVLSGSQKTTATIYNGDAAAIRVGNSTVAMSGATAGIAIAAAGTLQIPLNPGDSLFAISTAGTAASAVTVVLTA